MSPVALQDGHMTLTRKTDYSPLIVVLILSAATRLPRSARNFKSPAETPRPLEGSSPPTQRELPWRCRRGMPGHASAHHHRAATRQAPRDPASALVAAGDLGLARTRLGGDERTTAAVLTAAARYTLGTPRDAPHSTTRPARLLNARTHSSSPARGSPSEPRPTGRDAAGWHTRSETRPSEGQVSQPARTVFPANGDGAHATCRGPN